MGETSGAGGVIRVCWDDAGGTQKVTTRKPLITPLNSPTIFSLKSQLNAPPFLRVDCGIWMAASSQHLPHSKRTNSRIGSRSTERTQSRKMLDNLAPLIQLYRIDNCYLAEREQTSERTKAVPSIELLSNRLAGSLHYIYTYTGYTGYTVYIGRFSVRPNCDHHIIWYSCMHAW